MSFNFETIIIIITVSPYIGLFFTSNLSIWGGLIFVLLLKFNTLNFNKVTLPTYNIFLAGLLDNRALVFLVFSFLLFYLKLKMSRFSYILLYFITFIILNSIINNSYMRTLAMNLNTLLFSRNSDYSTELINGLFFLHPLFFFLIITYSTLRLLGLINLRIRSTLFLRRFNFYLLDYYNFSYSLLIFSLLILSLITGSWWAQQELNWSGWWSWDNIELISFNEFLVIFFYLHCYIFYKKKDNFIALLTGLIIIFFIILRFNLMITRHTFLVELNNLQFIIYGFFLIAFILSRLINRLVNVLFFYFWGTKVRYDRWFIFLEDIPLKTHPFFFISKVVKLYSLFFSALVLYYFYSLFSDYLSYYTYLSQYIKLDSKGSYYILVLVLLIQMLRFTKIKNYIKYSRLYNIFPLFSHINSLYKTTIVASSLKNKLLILHEVTYLFILHGCICFFNINIITPLFFFDFLFYGDISLNSLASNLKLSNFYLNNVYMSNVFTFWETTYINIELVLLSQDSLSAQSIESLFGRFTHLSSYNQQNLYMGILNSAGLNILIVDLLFIFYLFILLSIFVVIIMV